MSYLRLYAPNYSLFPYCAVNNFASSSLSVIVCFMLALFLYLKVSLKKQWRGKLLLSPRLRPFTSPVPMRVSQQAKDINTLCLFRSSIILM